MHIPLELYPYFLSSVLQLFFHEVSPIDDEYGDTLEADAAKPTQPAFLNFSITPVECSIMCPRLLADEYLAPLVDQFHLRDPSSRDNLSISKDDYIAMQVVGVGLGAGQRVLDLTSLLAMAGMYVHVPFLLPSTPILTTYRSIFFITTYFSDYIVIPLHSKPQVIDALQDRGFQFEPSSAAFTPQTLSTSSTPTPTLQPPAITSLHAHKITPIVDRSLRLIHCAARYDDPDIPSSLSLLRPALTTLLLIDSPRFLSLTLTATDHSASLLTEKRLLPRFTADTTSESLLLRSVDEIVPITLDLRSLPLDASGVVCAVAARLADATRFRYDRDEDEDDDSGSESGFSFDWDGSCGSGGEEDVVCLSSLYCEDPAMLRTEPPPAWSEVDIGFLSSARAATIVVARRRLKYAVEALEVD